MSTDADASADANADATVLCHLCNRGIPNPKHLVHDADDAFLCWMCSETKPSREDIVIYAEDIVDFFCSGYVDDEETFVELDEFMECSCWENDYARGAASAPSSRRPAEGACPGPPRSNTPNSPSSRR